jgi:hypothetical protein
MVTHYQTLVLRLAWRRIARAEHAERHGLRIVPPAPDIGPRPPTHLRLVHSNAARSGSIQLVRAVHDSSRSRE